MKKRFSILTVFAFLFLFSIYSCNTPNSATEIDDESLIEFKEDLNLQHLVNNAKSYKLALNAKEARKIDFTLGNVVENCKILNEKYGEKHVMACLKILIEEEKKNKANDSSKIVNALEDSCHRNKNGTVNTDACSAWEMIAYLFSAAINCGPGEATEWYYDCCQAAACRNC